MPETFFDAPDFEQWYSESGLLENFGVKFVGNGWYPLEKGDTLLIIERYGKFKVWAWVANSDPREDFERVLDLKWYDQ